MLEGPFCFELAAGEKRRMMNFTDEFWVQIMVYAISFAGAFGSLVTKIKYIEKKLDKHNCFVERMIVVEQSVKSAHKRINGLEERG